MVYRNNAYWIKVTKERNEEKEKERRKTVAYNITKMEQRNREENFAARHRRALQAAERARKAADRLYPVYIVKWINVPAFLKKAKERKIPIDQVLFSSTSDYVYNLPPHLAKLEFIEGPADLKRQHNK